MTTVIPLTTAEECWGLYYYTSNDDVLRCEWLGRAVAARLNEDAEPVALLIQNPQGLYWREFRDRGGIVFSEVEAQRRCANDERRKAAQ